MIISGQYSVAIREVQPCKVELPVVLHVPVTRDERDMLREVDSLENQ